VGHAEVLVVQKYYVTAALNRNYYLKYNWIRSTDVIY